MQCMYVSSVQVFKVLRCKKYWFCKKLKVLQQQPTQPKDEIMKL